MKKEDEEGRNRKERDRKEKHARYSRSKSVSRVRWADKIMTNEEEDGEKSKADSTESSATGVRKCELRLRPRGGRSTDQESQSLNPGKRRV